MTPESIALAAGLIRRFEGCSLVPYRDPVGVWSIGYGCRWLANGRAVTYNAAPLTQEQADALLSRTLTALADQVGEQLPPGATDGQAAALLDFAYNEGVYALKRSTLLRLFRAGDIEGAADQFRAWVYAGGRMLPGLVTRRNAERALFTGRPAFGDDDPPAIHETADALNAAELQRLARDA